MPRFDVRQTSNQREFCVSRVRAGTLHHTTRHYTPLHYTTLHFTTLRCTTTLHCTTLLQAKNGQLVAVPSGSASSLLSDKSNSRSDWHMPSDGGRTSSELLRRWASARWPCERGSGIRRGRQRERERPAPRWKTVESGADSLMHPTPADWEGPLQSTQISVPRKMREYRGEKMARKYKRKEDNI